MIVAALILSLVFVNSRYQIVKQNYQTLKQQYHAQIEAVKLQQQKIDALHQFDIQHTEALSYAKAEITKLNDAVRAGTQRLHVNTVCPISKTTPTQSRHNEAPPQLGASTRQDYFRLREMMIENEKQTEYLQQYIKTQCQFISPPIISNELNKINKNSPWQRGFSCALRKCSRAISQKR